MHCYNSVVVMLVEVKGELLYCVHYFKGVFEGKVVTNRVCWYFTHICKYICGYLRVPNNNNFMLLLSKVDTSAGHVAATSSTYILAHLQDRTSCLAWQ